MTQSKMLRKSFLAGALIAIGALFSMSAKPYGNVVQGLCFSVGLFMVFCVGAPLFTGVMTSIQLVLSKQIDVDSFVIASAVAWPLNLLGAVAVALLANNMGFDATAIAQTKASMSFIELLSRAVMCNVLVCFAAWAYRESGHTITEALLASMLPVACFVACGYEHCVADMFYMPLGFMQGAVSFSDCAYVVLVATVGNMAGGIAFSLLSYDKG